MIKFFTTILLCATYVISLFWVSNRIGEISSSVRVMVRNTNKSTEILREFKEISREVPLLKEDVNEIKEMFKKLLKDNPGLSVKNK